MNWNISLVKLALVGDGGNCDLDLKGEQLGMGRKRDLDWLAKETVGKWTGWQTGPSWAGKIGLNR